MKKVFSKFKKGVASFYIVAFSTLVLVIVASSFAMVILSEVTRTSNDDLSQSAYDSALAGVEDAKLAYSNYRRCVTEASKIADPVQKNAYLNPTGLTNSTVVECQDIIYWMNHPDCDMVGHILGRIGKFDSGEVMVSDTVESTDGEDVTSDLNQAYTCVQIKTEVEDYRSTLTTTNQTRMVKVSFDDNVSADNIQAVKVSWYSNRADTSHEYSNFVSTGSLFSTGARVAFQPATTMRVSTPPTLEVQLIQTAPYFTLNEFDIAKNGQTNRATVYLVPSNDAVAVANTVETEYYIGTYNGATNYVKPEQIVKTNNRQIKNLPFGVWCDNKDSEFACSAILHLPKPVGGQRSNDTFMMALSLPYSQPDTDFSLEFCTTSNCVNAGGDSSTAIAGIRDSQVVIDSTGRANDLYRRVETRLESADTSFAYPYYAIQLLDSSDESALVKNMTVTCEHTSIFFIDGTPGCLK